jgi:hypothetical protein
LNTVLHYVSAICGVSVMNNYQRLEEVVVASCNIIRDVMLCYVMLCYVMLCYVMLCYVMLCYVMFCYVMQ